MDCVVWTPIYGKILVDQVEKPDKIGERFLVAS